MMPVAPPVAARCPSPGTPPVLTESARPGRSYNGEQLAVAYARTRRPEVREQAILGYRNLVEILAAKMTRKGVPIEDLIQVGTIGLIAALDRFDPDRGVKFTTYAVNTIVGEMKHYFRDCTWVVKVPRQLQEVAASIHRANELLARELGRAPTIGELAKRLQLSEELIVEAMELDVVYAPYSLDAHLGQDDAENHERLTDVLGECDVRLEQLVNREPLRQALDDLEPRKRWILRRRYFDDWSQSEVGRAMGISQMHVSRLEREALGELKRAIAG